MDDRRLERIEVKIDDVSDRIGSIDATLAAQHVSLELHIKRTNLLEEKLAPVERHVAMLNGALKLLGILAVLGGLLELYLRLH